MSLLIFISICSIQSVLCNVACVPNEPQLLLSSSGIIESPGYGSDSYPKGSICVWYINSTEGYNIHVRFDDFDLDEVKSCSGDSVILMTDTFDILRVFCGKSKPRDIITFTSFLVVKFRSDYIYSGRGFKLSYSFTSKQTVCPEAQIECRNRNCVDRGLFCDGKDDCGDDSDESFCKQQKISTNFECGTPLIFPNENSVAKVVGGYAAVEGSWPWQVDIQLNMIEPNGHVCGGTLISPDYVLTAAHCFLTVQNLSSYKLVFGNYDRFKNTGNEQIRYIKQYVIYPMTLGSSFEKKLTLELDLDSDIAIIKLSSPVKITDRVQPICLPSTGKEIAFNTRCFSTGWGSTRGTGGSNVLKQLQLFSANRSTCRITGEEDMTDSKICFSSRVHENGLCGGDSGGPLACKFDRWYLMGIASHLTSATIAGPVCGVSGSGIAFLKVSAKIKWITLTRKVLDNY